MPDLYTVFSISYIEMSCLDYMKKVMQEIRRDEG